MATSSRPRDGAALAIAPCLLTSKLSGCALDRSSAGG